MWEEEQEKRGTRVGGLPNDGLENREQSWQINTDAPSDLLVRVGDVDFHVHKFPLLSRSGKLNRLFHDRRHDPPDQLLLPDLPGGAAAFQLAAKFCYGLPIDLSAATIASLRCAAEFLEMTEDLDDGNLIFKTEAFLSYVVLSSWRDSIIVLRSCETLYPWAENLQIVRRCSESIAWKTFSESIEFWIEDLATLRIDHFVRVISAMKSKGIKPDLLGSAIMFFAERWIQSEDGIRIAVSGSGEKRTVVESLISIIPQDKDCVSCGFLMKMVRFGGMLGVSQALMADLEKRAGMQLEQAELADLLIPAYGGAAETMYDVDLVRRMVEQFLLHEHDEESGAMTRVARLLDSYLTEVARDRNLSTSKFQALAEALPEMARISDDGLYRAVDSYLKAHPATTEHERKRLCRVMDCQKLSMDACMHAAQNERLPLRTTLHVLFSEQLKLSAAISGGDVLPQRPLPPDDLAATKKEITVLKFELDAMKAKYLELQADLEGLQRQLDRGLARQHKSPSPSSSGWTSGWKKLSRLNKKGTDGRAAAAAPPVEVAAPPPGRKGQRRWRNSIS